MLKEAYGYRRNEPLTEQVGTYGDILYELKLLTIIRVTTLFEGKVKKIMAVDYLFTGHNKGFTEKLTIFG